METQGCTFKVDELELVTAKVFCPNRLRLLLLLVLATAGALKGLATALTLGLLQALVRR